MFPISVFCPLSPVPSVSVSVFPVSVHGLLFPVSSVQRLLFPVVSTVHSPQSTVSGVHCFVGTPCFRAKQLSPTRFPQSTVMPITPPGLAGCGLVLRGFTVGCPQSPVSCFLCPRFRVHGFHSPLSTLSTVHGFQTVTCSFPSPLSPSSFSTAPTSDPRPSAWGCLRVFPRVSPQVFPRAPG